MHNPNSNLRKRSSSVRRPSGPKCDILTLSNIMGSPPEDVLLGSKAVGARGAGFQKQAGLGPRNSELWSL